MSAGSRPFPRVTTVLRGLVVCGLVVAAVLMAGCGGGSSTAAQAGAEKVHFKGAEASPPQPAAPLRLRNYLSESVDVKQYKGKAVLGRVWKDWNIVAKPAKAGRDLVEHSALIYGIGADGKVMTLYAANFK